MDMSVPIPALGYQRWMKPRVMAKNGFSGESTLDGESPMRNSICAVSGGMDKYMNMGTSTGAVRVHCAEPEVMNRLITEISTTMPANNTTGGTPAEPSTPAVLMASTVPMLDQSNHAMNWAAAKKSTISGATWVIAEAIMGGTSEALPMVPATIP